MATVTEAVATFAPPTDEPFVTLVENQLAVAAVEQFVEVDPDDSARLVYLYGPSGTGKSHLVRQFLWLEGQKPVPPRYAHLTAAEFVAELDEAAAGGVVHEFREKHLGLDLLVCEDLAAIERKPESQRLLTAILDETIAAGGRVLLTCSKAPGELEGVSARLVSRFYGGVCVGIGPPGPSSRAQLLSTFARVRHLTVPADVLQSLADRLPASPRELKAAVAGLDALARAERLPIVNRALAERFLDDAVAPPAPDLPAVAKAVAKEFGLTPAALRTGGRTAATSLPRQVAMSLARELTGHPLERIAAFFGRQNHGTVIHARKKLAARLEDDAELRRHVAQIRRRLGVAGR
ncbi:MAG TPA: DnaA/Hda family protein [Planctomycetaceae bacterium]